MLLRSRPRWRPPPRPALLSLQALRELLRVLGGDWGLLLTDGTKGQPGNNERLGFVFDTRRVKPSGLAAELVIPDEELEDTPSSPVR